MKKKTIKERGINMLETKKENKKMLKEIKGITLIALVITIIVLLILAGVSIAMLTGENGILTQAENAKIEQSHGAVKDAISLLYNEYQIKINTASNTKLASTETVIIEGKEEKSLADTTITFIEFLQGNNELGINYIKSGSNETGYILDVEKLAGAKQELGNGTNSDDVYKIKETNGNYIVSYYKNETEVEDLWNTTINLEEGDLDWDTILEQATSPHPDQEQSKDIGIGTDGQLVNLDLWNYEKTEDGKGWNLNGAIPCSWRSAYLGDFDENGRIEGTVPQYIKGENEEFLPVKEMTGTFGMCDEIQEAPAIPSTVTSMKSTFWECSNLKKASEIPVKVINMEATFFGCEKLTGNITINANPTSYYICFGYASTATGTDLKLTGSSTMLQKLLNTKSKESNISIMN